MIRAFSFFPRFEYKLKIARQVMPLTLVFLGMIVFNNLCLKYVEVSFYQVARSLTIVFNVIFTYFLLNKSTSRNAIICCAVITLGYLLGCDGEVKFSILVCQCHVSLLLGCSVALWSLTLALVAFIGCGIWRIIISICGVELHLREEDIASG